MALCRRHRVRHVSRAIRRDDTGVTVTVHVTSSSTLWRSHFLAARVLHDAIKCTGRVSSVIPKLRHAWLPRATSCRRARARASWRLSCGTDLPDGRACRFRVQPLLQKYSGFPKTQITLYPLPSRPDQRGVGHRRERWGGLRWTRQRRVCKGSQGGFPVSDDRHADERCCLRTAKSCGPDASTPASSLAEGKSARPGADEPGFREMTVTRKPITGESAV
jgi:hypothetical protein